MSLRVAAWTLIVSAAVSGCAHGAGASLGTQATLPALAASQLLEVAAAAERLGDPLRAQQYVLAARKAGADPNITLPWLLRLYVGDGQYRMAIDTAREQLRSHPQQFELRMLLASLYRATDLEVAAIEQYEQVLVTQPSEPRAHFALASLLHEGGHDAARADQHFRAYLALAPAGAYADQARSLLLKELP
jgi:tetratricopeptide (TPR) repeat protein